MHFHGRIAQRVSSGRRAAAITTLLVTGLLGPGRPALAADANAVIDKAVQALGGAEKLGKVTAASWTSKGTLSIGGAGSTARASRNTSRAKSPPSFPEAEKRRPERGGARRRTHVSYDFSDF